MRLVGKLILVYKTCFAFVQNEDEIFL